MSEPKPSSPASYKFLDASDASEEGFDNDPLLPSDLPAARRSQRRSWFWPVLCGLSWVITVVAVVMYLWDRNHVTAHSYEQGWETDFFALKGSIGVEQKTFIGGPIISEAGEMLVPNKSPIRYVGQPSPEVDYAWEQLVEGRYFLVTEEEAKRTWGAEYRDYWSDSRGGYVAGLDVFHTLHCLDRLRKQLHPDYYPPHSHSTGPEGALIHTGHCVDQIRQYIMCAGDVTVLGTKYYSGVNRNYVLSDVPHTCRSFEQIREWTWERYNGSTSVKPVYKMHD